MISILISLALSVSAQAATVKFLPNTIVPREFRDAIRGTIDDQCSHTDLALEETQSISDIQTDDGIGGVYQRVYATEFKVSYKENGVIVEGKILQMRSVQTCSMRLGCSRRFISRIFWAEEGLCGR